MAGLTRYSTLAATLRQRNFALYLWGGWPALVGMWVHRVAVGWLTWELTHSGTWLGLIAVADLAPTVFVTPLAGVIADRMDRRILAIYSQALAMLQAVALTILTFTGAIEIWSLFALTFFLGIVLGVNTAARLAMVPNLLPLQYVPSAVAMDSALFNIARFLGPAIAGVIIAIWGVWPAFLFNSVTFVIYLAALFMARLVRDEGGGRHTGGMMAQILEGFRYARRHPGIGPMLLLLCAAALGIKPFLELLPGFADAVFDRGATGLAQMTAIAGVGAFISAIWLAQRGTPVGLTKFVIGGLVLGGLAVLGFTATQDFRLALVGVFFAGMSTTLCGTGTQTLMQGVVDGAMRGRVMSLYGVIFRGGPALGALAMGSASEVIGLQPAVAAGSVICFAAWLWLFRRQKDIIPVLEGGKPP